MANESEHQYWNDGDGPTWVALQTAFDAMLEPFVPRLCAQVSPQDTVLEVGCGTGTLAMELATTASWVTAVDISAPMLERAREVAEDAALASIDFVQADAQIDEIPGGPFDAVVSRFGVMFFDDPIAAFTNIRSVTRDGGSLAFACWQSPEHQAWMRPPMIAASKHLELTPPPAGDPHAPGMFAFADPDYVRTVLETAGFTDVVVDAVEQPFLMGGHGGGVDGAIEQYTSGLRVRMMLDQADPDTRTRILDDLRADLGAHLADDEVRLDGAAWFVTARATQ